MDLLLKEAPSLEPDAVSLALLHTARVGGRETIRRLADAGADINYRNDKNAFGRLEDWTPLTLALAEASGAEEWLLSAGADPHIPGGPDRLYPR